MEEVFGTVEELMAMEAPVSAPYEHLYRARELLKASVPGTTQEQLTTLALLGKICVLVEEPHVAQPYLEKALQVLPECNSLLSYAQAAIGNVESVVNALPKIYVPGNVNVNVADVVDVLQQLGMLWVERSLPLKALCFLTAAEDIGRDERDVHTHTLFYLAQVYTQLNQSKIAAGYCQQTLQRQLESNQTLPSDWSKNCLGLSAFYIASNQLHHAMECVFACKDFAQDEDTVARVAIVEAKVLFELLRSPCQPTEKILFPSLKLPSIQDAMWPYSITSYDHARDIFKRAMSALDLAKNVFVLDGYVTDHIRILQLQSQAYTRLIEYEQDRKRQIAMLNRRLGFLTPLLFEDNGNDSITLNRNAFGYLVQELLFEAADVYGVLHDLKCSNMTSSYATTNHYALDGIRCLERFLKLYFFQQGTDSRSELDVVLPSPLTRPTQLEKDEDSKPFVTGVFYLARLYGKLNFTQVEKTVAAWSKSLQLHENILHLVPPNANFFKDERAISVEMTQLLPEKINRLHFQNKHLG
ncbi:hypothetical protein THRCLA_03937 [Thraustotheca clavata]|uniref:KIF-binding protein n=1 Tax=Thraustotheca clavata TaxID=74557 RepID=A0A1W0A168_9STRA|nr:hypothetical protein THRCLA_03937 [Thraustotheca clavata]